MLLQMLHSCMSFENLEYNIGKEREFCVDIDHGCINLTKRFRQLKFLNVPFSKLLHRNCGQLIGSSFLINKLKFRQNPQKLFILAKTVTFMSCSVFVTRSMMLLLYFKILSISQLLSKTAKSSYQLQGHEGRSVQFKLS